MPYFTRTDIPAFGRARSDTVDANFINIESGFGMLPTETELKHGKVTVGTDSGIADAYVVALPYSPGAYADGLEVVFKASNTNAGASTINVNSLGVKSIKRQDGSALVPGDITAAKFITIRYNSTSAQFEIQANSGGLTEFTARFPNLAATVTATDVDLNRTINLQTGYLSKSVAGAVDVALTEAEQHYAVLEFTGALTGNINVTVGDDKDGWRWIVKNSTTGAYTLTFKTVSGTGLSVPQGGASRVHSDAAGIVDSETADDGRDGLVYDSIVDAITASNNLVSSVRQLWARINSEEKDVKILIISDSTGNDAWEWVYLLAQWFSTQASTHSITYRLYDSVSGWPSATTLSTGTGARTIQFWNGAVAGSVAEDFEGGHESVVWAGNDFDCVVVNMGHNYGTTSTEQVAYVRFIETIGNVVYFAPHADILVTLQNPRTDFPEFSARMIAAWRSVSAQIGCGVIDVYSLFEAHPNPSSLMGDTIHPNAAGQALWLTAVKTEIRKPLALNGAPHKILNQFTQAGKNYLLNPRFSAWVGAAPDGWTLENATAERDPWTSDSSLYSLKATIGASGTPALSRSIIGGQLAVLRGKTVTAVMRVYKPAGMDALAGRLGLTSNNGSASVTLTSYARGEKSVNGWTWEVSQIQVQQDATSLTITAYLGGASGVDSGKTINIESVALFVGVVPFGIAQDDEGSKALTTWYYSSKVVLHPTLGTGSLTVNGADITLTGATPTQSAVIFNLPQLVVGANYQLTFTPQTITGATVGQVYIRSGWDGGSSNLVSDTWSVTGSAKTVAFTGISGPVCVWVQGGSTATGWYATAFNVTQV